MKKSFFVLFLAMVMLFAGCGEEPVVESELPNGNSPITMEPATPLPQTSPTVEQTSLEPLKNTNIQVLTPKAADIEFAVYSEEIFCIYSGYYSEESCKYGYMRADGTEITQYMYDYAYPFNEGLACVRLDGKYGFIDRDGNTALPFIYD